MPVLWLEHVDKFPEMRSSMVLLLLRLIVRSFQCLTRFGNAAMASTSDAGGQTRSQAGMSVSGRQGLLRARR
jgi:hypothetical protein